MSVGWLRWLCAVLVVACAGWLPARAASSAPVLAMDLLEAGTGELSVAVVAARRDGWRPGVARGVVYPFQPGRDLWVRLRISGLPASDAGWQLQFALPSIGEVAFYTHSPQGWREQRAGEHVPGADWPMAGRYPRFELPAVPAGTALEVYLRVRNERPAPFALRLQEGTQADASQHAEYLLIGVAVGGLLLLGLPSVVLARIYRQPAFGWYAAFAILAALALLSLSGVLGELLLGDFPEVARRVKGTLALLAAATSVMLTSAVCRTAARVPRLAVTDLVIAGASGVLSLFTWLSPQPILIFGLGLFLALCAGAAMTTAVVTWRRGDPVGIWMVAANVPWVLVAALALARGLGLQAFPFGAYALAAAAFAPAQLAMFGALYLRNREIHQLRARHNGLANTDAVTGTLASYVFFDRLAAACQRHRKGGVPAAVLYVRISNLRYIRESLGATVAEQSVIRAAFKLRLALSEADTVARVDEDTFGVIFDFALEREALARQTSRLVAHGLMAPKGLQPPVVLQFHVAAWQLAATPATPQEIDTRLRETLAAMVAGTRRPIRFVQEPDVLEPDLAA